MNASFDFSCPRCREKLFPTSQDVLTCPADNLRFERIEGIWHFLLPERQPHFEQFIREYETIRRGEGRGSAEAEYYRALPYHDLSGRMSADWRIRAESFSTFLKVVLVPLEKSANQPLTILDLGAGNGWLSNRLAKRGHKLAAVDLTVNDFDGLGCYRYYDSSFLPVQAEFDLLPFNSHSADIIVYNASLHYSEDYLTTLSEALRVIKADGRLVILDSPFYKQAASGVQMVREREAGFIKQFGFPSHVLDSVNYLTYSGVRNLGALLNLRWECIKPNYDLRWRFRPLIARLLGRREPAKFEVLVGRLVVRQG